MPGKDTPKLTKRTVDGFSAEDKDAVYWDRELPGFGARVYTTGRKVYVVQTRGPGGPKRVTIGRHGEMSADEARKQAAVIIDRIKRGEDPVPPPPQPEFTVADLAERYLQVHVAVNCRPGTRETFVRIVTKYIVPELGDLAVETVDRAHVVALHDKLRDKPYQANKTVDVLAKMFRLAEAWGLTPATAQPVPVGAPLQGASARAVPHPRRVPAARPGAGCSGGRRFGPAFGGCGDPFAAADRMPEERDRDAALGRCGPHGGRAAASRHQNRRAAGAADLGGRRSAGRHSPHQGQPLGDRGQKAGMSSGGTRHYLDAPALARRA